jgi:hypothetical protein
MSKDVGEDGLLEANRHCMPYVVFKNQDDIITGKSDLLGAGLDTTLDRLLNPRMQLWLFD